MLKHLFECSKGTIFLRTFVLQGNIRRKSNVEQENKSQAPGWIVHGEGRIAAAETQRSKEDTYG